MNSNSESIIILDNLTVMIDDVEIIGGVSFDIQPGRTLALVGESGSGKSMTALSILRLLPETARISAGRIILDGKDYTRASEQEMRSVRGRKVSMIFQEPSGALDPLMTVGDQIIEAILAHGRVSRQTAWDQALKLLELVGISEPKTRMDQYPFELSGGMCQRIMIASALSCRPALLIADEPTTALDVTIQAQILDLIRHMRDELDMAVVLITHDMGVVADMADSVAIMYAGRVVEQGDVFDVFKQPKHPYTRLLLKSIPRIDGLQKETLHIIEGVVPDARHWPTGCRFHTRCPLADTRCEKERPPLAPVEGGTGKAACWNYKMNLEYNQ